MSESESERKCSCVSHSLTVCLITHSLAVVFLLLSPPPLSLCSLSSHSLPAFRLTLSLSSRVCPTGEAALSRCFSLSPLPVDTLDMVFRRGHARFRTQEKKMLSSCALPSLCFYLHTYICLSLSLVFVAAFLLLLLLLLLSSSSSFCLRCEKVEGAWACVLEMDVPGLVFDDADASERASERRACRIGNYR